MPLPEFKGEEFEFPDEKEAKGKPQEPEFEIEIEDDTPEQDRGRKPAAAPVDEVTDEELASYDEKVQKRIKKFTRGYHDERRAKEAALREQQEAIELARRVLEENKKLKTLMNEDSAGPTSGNAKYLKNKVVLNSNILTIMNRSSIWRKH